MPFRVYAPAHRISDTDYALEVGKSVLQMYEGMFNLSFPLPKSGESLCLLMIRIAMLSETLMVITTGWFCDYLTFL